MSKVVSYEWETHLNEEGEPERGTREYVLFDSDHPAPLEFRVSTSMVGSCEAMREAINWLIERELER